jgi:cell shape-determining protein MreD
MRNIIIILIISAFVERLGFGFPLFAPFVMLFLFDIKSKPGLNLAILAGICYDLLLGRLVGLSAVLFLVMLFQIYITRQRFDSINIGLVTVLATLSSLEIIFILGLPWSITYILSFVLVSIIGWYALRQSLPLTNRGDIFLKQ